MNSPSDDEGASPRSWGDRTSHEVPAPQQLTAEQREANKSVAAVWIVAGGAVMIVSAVVMWLGQVLPVFALCLIGFLAGGAALLHGRSIGNR